MTDKNEILLNMDKITFPEGLVGIPEWKNFSITQTMDMLPIALLNCRDAGNLSLIVANPAAWYPQYAFDVTDEDLAVVKAKGVDNLVTLAVINVDSDPFNVTANLVSPILINPAEKLGVQIVLHKSPYLVNQPLTLKTMVVHFEDGLAGLPEYKNFVLQVADELLPVMLLVSQDEKRISFPVIDPFLINPEYSPRLDEKDAAALNLSSVKDASWFVILNVVNDPMQVTANMIAPLAINPASGVGRQVILSKSGYHPSYPIKTIEIGKNDQPETH